MKEKKTRKAEKGMGIIYRRGEIARNRGIKFKILKKMTQDRDQCRKWIRYDTLRANGEGGNEEEEIEITYI